ncbi:MAG: adenylyl-sulfate kinase [Oscillospiraceae bacterium]|nr:adenylyl-sulfate kinase [Oscillospiraceae bacterium]
MNKVYWITGLSGAGKTAVGKALYEKIKPEQPNTVLLDGDELREVFGGDLGYSAEDRRKCAMRYSKLCKMLSEQGLNVIICTISMFHEIHEWNRENIPGYTEIFLDVPFEILKKRDQKGLYSDYGKGTSNNLIGLDIKAEKPKNPDIIIENNGSISITECIERILRDKK